MIDTYIRHSPSKCNLYAAQPAMFVLENVLGHKQPVGIPAHRGVAVEDGVNAGLNDMAAYDRDCVDVALTKYDSLTAMSGDPRREKYRDTIPDMVTTALDELRRYGKPTEMQGFVTWEPPELKLPIVGYFDYAWSHIGILADLKTTERMPSEIKRGHARQVALYATSDNIDARLIYVTPKKLEAYHLENIAEHRASLLKIAATIERFLALSDDPEFFVSITTPDVESFYWADPAARQLAYRHWGV